jgi:hypothetical protein
MKTLRKLKQFAAKAGLVTLAAGFGFLGILSFCVKNGAEVNNLASDRQLSTIVSSIDLLIAATFLLYAMLYWRRTPEIVEQSGEAQYLYSPRPKPWRAITIRLRKGSS